MFYNEIIRKYIKPILLQAYNEANYSDSRCKIQNKFAVN